MAWRSSGKSSEELVKNLATNGIIQNDSVVDVCLHAFYLMRIAEGLPQDDAEG